MKIAMLTAYDATFARLVDQAGVDVLLVGDSLGMVVQGHDNTLPVTHRRDDLSLPRGRARHRARAGRRRHAVHDVSGVDRGRHSQRRPAGQGGRRHAVKLEGGAEHAELVARLVDAGIPVMGHIGLTPQSVHALGGFKVQGRDAGAAKRLLDDARALEQAGAYAIVLEGIPRELARRDHRGGLDPDDRHRRRRRTATARCWSSTTCSA